MKKTLMISTLMTLLLLASFASFRATAVSIYPAPETQTLMTSLAPPNATLGNNVTWLVWTDPNASGQIVHLNIYDATNTTTILDVNETLGTLNKCGSLQKQVSTAGFQPHMYTFTAEITIGNMEIESSRDLDFRPIPSPQLTIYAYASPYTAIPGDSINLIIYEANSPYVDATANVTVYNVTNPALRTLNDVTIPSINGSRMVQIPTTGFSAGSYSLRVTATSAIGNDTTTTTFYLFDIIVQVDDYLYYIGEMVNVSIRAIAAVSQVGLQIFSLAPFPPVFVVNDTVTLTNGHGSKLYNSSSWSPRFYSVLCNATVDSTTASSYAYFFLEAFAVNISFDKTRYVAGEMVNVTVSTTPPQSNAWFNLTVKNSIGGIIWTYGPSNLNPNGKASLQFNTTGLQPDFYDVEAFVNNTQYLVNGVDTFEIFVPAFNIFASVEPYSNAGYAMPTLNVTVTPEQTGANLTIQVGSASYYTFIKHDFNISTYLYPIPATGMTNDTHYVGVSVTSSAGTNLTETSFSYSNGKDSDGDGLSDSAEQTAGTLPHAADSDGDGFFDGMEVFLGSNPLDPGSVVSEMLVIPYVAALSMISAVAIVAKLRKRKAIT
jgi:hypothetical protein